MRRIIIILLFSVGSMAFAQQRSFIEVDASTYQQYMSGDWTALIENGENAIDNNIDYFYLHMRIAYAYFKLKKYRKAAEYYKNALHHNSKDAIAHEYLYYCYLYSGRDSDALFQRQNLSDKQIDKLGINDSIKIVSLGLNFTYGQSDAEKILTAIDDNSSTVDGAQKAGLKLIIPQISLSHRIGNIVKFNHSISFLQKNEISNVITAGISYLSPEQTITQYEYSLNMDITPKEGWRIMPGIHYLHTSIPIFQESDYGQGMGQNRVAVDYQQIKNNVYKIYIEKQFSMLSAGASWACHQFNKINTQQIGIHTTIYPLYNLNLYISANVYGQKEDHRDFIDYNLIFNTKIGGKIHKNLWLELNGTFPENMGFYDIQNSIAYNNLEKSNYKFGLTAIIPAYKIKSTFFIAYKYDGTNSYFFPENIGQLPFNQQSYKTQFITGGIKWKI